MNRAQKLFFGTVLLTFALMLAGPANTSVVLSANFEEVVRNAAVVFEGRVISKETRRSARDGRFYTYYTFEILDVIKGSYTGSHVELGFAGGTLNGLTLSVSGMHMPQVGERGVYFVESLTQELVHPFYGWHQGHYLVVTDHSDGTDKVLPALASSLEMITAPTVDEFKQDVRDKIGAAE